MYKGSYLKLFSALLLVVLCVSCTPNVESLDKEILDKIGTSLVLIDYQDDYVEIINSLPTQVTNEAKENLIMEIKLRYDKNNRQGGIKKPLVGVSDITSVREPAHYMLVISYQENTIFNNQMVDIIKLNTYKGVINEIKIKSYSVNYPYTPL